MINQSLLIPIAIAFLLVLSAFFSGSETALTAASRPRMHHLEKSGSQRARMVNRLREQQERLIGTVLLGNNLVNILASALATSLLIGWFGDAGVAYATVAMTLLVLIFAEVMPKTYAIANADRMALAVAPWLRPLVAALSPVSRAIQQVVRLILRLFRTEITGRTSEAAREEELRGAIALLSDTDADARREREMLRSILDLADVDVDEIMVHRKSVDMIDAELPPAQILERVVGSPYTRLPLYRDEPDNIIGVLHAKALLRAVQTHGGNVDAVDMESLAALPWFIPESTSLLRQLQAFRRRREHFAIVVDEYGALMGVVTLEDILEEIVGEISDEHDVPVAGVRAQRDGSMVVDGTVTIRDLNRQFEWTLPDEEAATIAGLVLHEARVIPEAGQVFEFHGFRFEILRRLRNQVTSLRLTRLPGG